MIIDNHAHVGWFRDGYHHPAGIWNDEREAGVDEICVSSTSTCAELYELVIDEMLELKSLACDKVHPILWLTPKMLTGNHLTQMLSASFLWDGVKIHPRAHPEWADEKALTAKAVELAASLGVPMLIHTDEDRSANAETFEFLYKAYPSQLFILAHGKPIEQILRLLPKYKNIVVDTAFMDIKQIQRIANNGYADRLIFGTDAPINRLFINKTTSKYIKDCISAIQKKLSPEEAHRIMGTTFYRKATWQKAKRQTKTTYL